jgi:hypothetical protein
MLFRTTEEVTEPKSRMDEFRIPERLHEEYARVKKQFLRKGHILAIQECSSELFKLPPQQQLEVCGLLDCTALEYMSYTYDSVQPSNERIGGRMFPVEKKGKHYSVILIRDDYGPDITPAQVLMYKFCILYHELGHAEDFYQGVNYNHTKREVSIKQAEGYADDFAVKHLKRIKCEEIVQGKTKRPSLADWYRKHRYKGVYSQ